MSISSAINTARTGLQISGLRAETVATNVANASTPGYVRRTVLLSEQTVAGQTTGVRSDGIARSQNMAITAERRGLTSDLAQSDMLATTWQTISSRVGSTAEGDGIFKAFSDFETALENYALSPESSTDAATVLNAAKAITREFNNLSQMTIDMRADADTQIADGVSIVNSALKQIEKLNGQISSADPKQGSTAALLDERQRQLDVISEYMPVQSVDRQNGMIDVVTQEGVFLLAGRARTVEFTPGGAFTPGRTLASGDLTGLTVEGTDITPGSSSFGAVSSGLFGGLFTLRDTELPEFSAQLDTLASDLVSRLSDDSIDPGKTLGAAGLFVDPMGTGAVGLALRLDINAAVDPAQGGATWRLRDGVEATTAGPSGNTDILNAMLDAVTSVRPVNANGIQGAFSSTDMVAQFASLTGQKRLGYEAVLSSTSTQHTMLLDAEHEASGVDVDSEMQDLLLIEQAYAANARVIETASNMIDRLMEL